MRKFLLALVALTAILNPASTLADNPRFKDIKSKLPALKPGTSRIYVYRAPKFGSLRHYTVSLDGKKIVDLGSNTVFYVDVSEGKHTIEIEDGKLTFTAYADENAYVATGYDVGAWETLCQPELIEKKMGEMQIAELDFQDLTKN